MTKSSGRGKLRTACPKYSVSYFSLLFGHGATTMDFVLLSGGVTIAMASGIPFPILGILFGQLVDDLNSNSCTLQAENYMSLNSKVQQKVLLMLYISIANFCAIFLYATCWSCFGERLAARFRRRFFRNLLQQDMAFFDRTTAGEICSQMNASVEMIRTGSSEKVGIFVSSFSYFVGAFAVAFIKAPRLAATLTFLVPAYLLLISLGGRYVALYSDRTEHYLGKASSLTSQSLRNIPLIHALCASDRLAARLSISVRQAEKEALKKTAVAAIQFGCMYFLSYCANSVAFWQGSKEITSGAQHSSKSISAGDVYTVIFVLLDASFVIGQVAPFLQIFSAATASAATLSRLAPDVSHRDDRSPSPLVQHVPVKINDISFNDVSFWYPSRPNVKVLRSVNIRFPAGKHTAIVGASGSGKSTIRSLLLRLYDPCSGKMALDNDQDLTQIDLYNWRGCLGVVDQEPVLFHCSIFQNIALGLAGSPPRDSSDMWGFIKSSNPNEIINQIQSASSGSSEESDLMQLAAKVIDSAIQADADDFIRKLPQGYSTIIGNSGCGLSGGQRQKIALARALVRDPQILILDEATSALDSASEQAIQSNLRKVRKGKTTITIAHRLATIKPADKIIVLHDGCPVQEGTHEELITQQEGFYVRMTSAQALVTSKQAPTDQTSSSDSVTTTKSDLAKTGQTQGILLDEGAIALKQPTSRKSPREDSTHQRSSHIGVISYFFNLLRPHWLWISLGGAGAVIAGGSYSGDAIIFGHTIGRLSPCQPLSIIRSTGNLAGLLFFLLAVAALVGNITAGVALSQAAERSISRVRVMIYRSLVNQNILWHSVEGRTPASLLSYFTSDTAALAGLSGTVVGTMLTVLTNLIASIILTHVIAWKIAIVLLATMPVLLGSGFMRLHVVARLQAMYVELFADSADLTLEATYSIKTITTFGLGEFFYDLYNRSLSKSQRTSLRQLLYTNFWLALAYSSSLLIYALAYWWGSKRIEAGDYSQTQFFIVLPALLFSAQSCGQILALAPDAANAKTAATRLFSLLKSSDTESQGTSGQPTGPDEEILASEALEKLHQLDEQSAPNAITATPNKAPLHNDNDHGATVEFKNIVFYHPSRMEIPVLQGLNLEIKSGQFCALIGPSGAGKSTILSLLERFYEPNDGIIEMDGRDIHSLDHYTHRLNLAYVPQENFLFDETVHFNVALGAAPGQDPSTVDVQSACVAAGIHDFITSLPEGYGTICGDRFSGGQKQRMCIARAFVRRPRLLLLDEPTSALDTEAESLLKATIRKVRGSMTVIVVAHRLHTVQDADCIFMIDGGLCVESGTHEELMVKSKRYREDVKHQALA